MKPIRFGLELYKVNFDRNKWVVLDWTWNPQTYPFTDKKFLLVDCCCHEASETSLYVDGTECIIDTRFDAVLLPKGLALFSNDYENGHYQVSLDSISAKHVIQVDLWTPCHRRPGWDFYQADVTHIR